MKQILSITRKELDSYFNSPMALIFVGAFLAVTLFIFFWAEAFFARDIADVRPLFRWMPLLLIFLVAALTMRQWSEEQRSGTLEVLLTLPVRPAQLVLGKFLAVMTLVGLALALTLPLPLTISNLGNLDWGPVAGGYLAALLLASAYAAIGLFVSSRTDNQIVALILSLLLGGLFYLVGSRGVTDFFGGFDEVFRALGTGSRFESIERGVIDVRDLIYYLALAGIFLLFNVLSLESKRWSQSERMQTHRRGMLLTSALMAVNLILLNVWVYPVQGLRLDLTQQGEFSLSQATKDLLANLQEPLVMRAYISENTHPLLAPLAPQVRDLLREYEIASNGRVIADVVDPASDPAVEVEATQTYGIQPTPLRVSGRFEASLINAYFDVLVRYGDQSAVLNFRDLIEVQSGREGSADVRLRNLEYDLTRAIKKAVFGFQSVDSVLAAMSEPARLTIVATPNTLPEQLQPGLDTIQKVAQEIQDQSNGKLSFEVIDPDAPGSTITRQVLLDTYGLQPIAVSLFSADTFYLNMLLTIGAETQALYPEADLSEASVRNAIESGLKRGSAGFLKVVGLWTPPAVPQQDVFGQMQQPLSSWQLIGQQLSRDYSVRQLDLTTGQVPPDVSVLVAIAPQNLTDKERFAIDQYLMRGGSVVLAAGNYAIGQDPFGGGFALTPVQNGVREMLQFYGIDVQPSLVMDAQNEPFPVQVVRDVNGVQVQGLEAVNYPFFPDIRSDAMDSGNPIVSRLSAATLNFVSPVVLDVTKNAERSSVVLMHSSAQAWLRTDTSVQPDFDLYPDLGFAVEGTPQSYALAVSVQGVFESYFKDKPSPFEATATDATATDGATDATAPTPTAEPIQAVNTIEKSPDTARLVVFGSAEFLDDALLQLSANLTADRYLSNLQLMQNAVDWSVEDLDLLTIRARGTITRVLKQMDQREESFWEALNYAIALLALVGIGLVWRARRRGEQPMPLLPISVQTQSETGKASS